MKEKVNGIRLLPSLGLERDKSEADFERFVDTSHGGGIDDAKALL
jgi:hypothetical protein